MQKFLLSLCFLILLPLQVLADATVANSVEATSTTAVELPAPMPMASESLQQQLVATQQDLKVYKRQATAQFENLAQKNSLIESQLLALEQQVSTLSQQVVTSENKIATSNFGLINQFWSYLPKNNLGWSIFALVALIVLLIWLPWPQRQMAQRREPIVNVNADDLDLGDEYDFMNSQEAIPAKLNLARAYIDMEDFSSAQQALKEVIRKGNANEQKQAKQLLATIPPHISSTDAFTSPRSS